MIKKILSVLIEAIFWLQFFITPACIGALIALFIYITNERLFWLSLVVVIGGVVLGVWYAERVRKKHGASRYASRILSTPDIWPDEYPGETNVKTDEG